MHQARLLLVGALLGCPTATPMNTDVPTETDAPPPVPPNVLILLADDVGLDNISAYGIHQDSAHTPTIDSLASTGLRFDRAWGTPACSPARAQLLTGRYGRRYGIGSIVRELQFVYPEWDLPSEELTVGELAQQAGYHTAFIGKWHLTSYQQQWLDAPGRHGFDRYRFVMGNLPVPSVPAVAGYYNWQRNDNGVVAFTQQYATTQQTDDAIAELATLEEPWLMVVAYSAGHRPFHVPPPELHTVEGVTASSPTSVKYRAMVEAMDTEIGRLLQSIDGVRDHTNVIFTADNGTPLEVLLAPTPSDQGKPTTQEGGLQVPLIVNGPGVAVDSRGRTTQTPAQLVDLLPTVAGWLEPQPLPELDGIDLAPWLANPDAGPGRRYQYAETFDRFDHPDDSERIKWAVRDDRWKYKSFFGEERLYDLENTRWDTEDLLAAGTEDPAVLHRMRDALETIKANAPLEHTQD